MVDHPSPRIPKLRRQKNRGGPDRAFVELRGERFYLGTWDSPESREAYRRTIAEWLATGQPPAREKRTGGADAPTIAILAARYLEWAEKYYRDAHGQPTGSAETAAGILRPVIALYKTLPAADFTPRCLEACAAEMVRLRWTRRGVNRALVRIRSIFKFGVRVGIVPSGVHEALRSVPGLKRGRTAAAETNPILPAPERAIEAVKPHLSRQVRAMVDVQLLTGARPGEVCIMRPVDIDMTAAVWLYTPADHKNAHREQARTIYLGPRAQAIITPFLTGRAVDAYLFSPIEAEAERRAALAEKRTTPLRQGNSAGTNRRRRPKRQPGPVYDTDSYRRAIHRACDAAGIDRWSPGRLRHNAGTMLRREYGLDTARAILGHRSTAVTEIYAEIDREKAVGVIGKVG